MIYRDYRGVLDKSYPNLSMRKKGKIPDLNRRHASPVTESRCSVADPDPGLGTFLTPGSGMGESQHQDPGSGMNNPDHIELRNHFFGFFGG